VQVQFQQTYSAQRRGRRTESGELFLRKPGRMRWQYSSPPGKPFLSDGRNLYLYTPASDRVEKTRVKESEDMRAPLAFLLGKLDFQKDFKKFTARAEGPDTWIVAEPKSDRLLFTQVGFLVNPSYEIRRLEVTGQDRSVMEFRFEAEKLNPRSKSACFASRRRCGRVRRGPIDGATGGPAELRAKNPSHTGCRVLSYSAWREKNARPSQAPRTGGTLLLVRRFPSRV